MEVTTRKFNQIPTNKYLQNVRFEVKDRIAERFLNSHEVQTLIDDVISDYTPDYNIDEYAEEMARGIAEDTFENITEDQLNNEIKELLKIKVEDYLINEISFLQ